MKHYFDLLAASIDYALHIQNGDSCLKIIQNINLLNKQAFNKDEFTTLFISNLPLIIKIQVHFETHDNETLSRIKAEIFKCLQQVLFPKSRFKDLSLGLKSLFEEGHDNQCMLLGKILECLSSTVNQSLFFETSCPVVFHAFVSSYKSDPVSVYLLFVAIAYLVGFNPEVKLSNSESKCLLKHKKFKKSFPEIDINKSISPNEKSLKVIKELVNLFSEANVELDSDGEIFPFHQWLQELVSEVFSLWSLSQDEQFLSNILEVFCVFIKLDPLIIGPKVSVILDTVMFSKKEGSIIKSAYTLFLNAVLRMFMKLSRLQKLMAKILELGKELGRRNVDDLPSVSDVLTSEFCEEFRTVVALLPSWQAIGIVRSLLYHLKQDCVTPLENPKGKYFSYLFYEINMERRMWHLSEKS